MRANAISRLPTQPDPISMFMQVKGSPFDSVRRLQTLKTALNFPDTEELNWFKTSKIKIFENLSRYERQVEDSLPIVEALACTVRMKSWWGVQGVRSGIESAMASALAVAVD